MISPVSAAQGPPLVGYPDKGPNTTYNSNKEREARKKRRRGDVWDHPEKFVITKNSIFRMVGTGNKKNEECGKVLYARACPDCHKVHSFRVETCRRLECPICWPSAVKRATARSVERLEAVKQAVGYKKTPRHFVISPDGEYFKPYFQNKKKFSNFRRNFYKILEDAGISAAVVVFHLWRYKETPSGEMWVYGPHFHVLGWGYIENVNEFIEKNPRWRYKNFDGSKTPGIGTDKRGRVRDMGATISYLLSHAAYIPGCDSVYYAGLAAPNQLRLTGQVERTETPLECGQCGEIVRQYQIKETPSGEIILNAALDPELLWDQPGRECVLVRKKRFFELVNPAAAEKWRPQRKII